jgi:hypothetical protein
MQSARAIRVAVAALAALVVLVAAPAIAEVYHVNLVNGTTIDTRYPPQDSSWDSAKLILLSDVGNWVSIAKSDVAGVTTDTQNRGFGFVIDTTTIALGWAPNDALNPEEQAEAEADAARAAALAPVPYSVDQFVEPVATQGIPAGWLGYGTVPPMGGVGAVAAPAPSPVSGGAQPVEPPQQ